MWKVEAVTLLMCGLLSIIVVLKRKWGRRTKKEEEGGFPPGPFAWPIIGHLYLLKHIPHQALRDVSTKYGHIIGLRLGQQRAVAVSSPELAKEVLLTHDRVFANRPPQDFTSIVLYGPSNDIIFGPHSPQWRKQRKVCTLGLFTAKRVRELAYVRQEELAALLQRVHEESHGGTRAIDIGRHVGQMSSHVVMRLLQSQATFEVEGENLQQLIREADQEVATPTVGDLIPCLSWLDTFRKRRMRNLHARIDKVLSAILAERTQSASRHDDLLHSLLSQEEAFTMDEIKGIILDMLAAGIHTTSLTLEWAMAELLKNPQCLHRLQREINTVLGMERQVSDADIPKLSYLKCVVKEVFRLHPALPLLVPRMSTEECTVHGYTIPANTRMFVNVWAIGRDEQVWPNANHFKPERFEGKDMDFRGQHFELLPFGSGRRICLGLPMALSIVEVTLANLVNCFDWELPNGESCSTINMDEKRGISANKATPMLAIPKLQVSALKSFPVSLTTM